MNYRSVFILCGWLYCTVAFGEPPLASTLVSQEANRIGVPAGLIYENLDNPYLFWVELDAAKLHLLERIDQGQYIRKSTRPISIGKKGAGKEVEGDLKTPIGVYQITSYLKDKDLDDFYGVGAYPVNFPNIWDRMLNRTGHGIWLHGLPKGVDSRPPLDSEGCVIIDNTSIRNMKSYITTGESLFVLSPSLTWLPSGENQDAADILEAIEGWRASWESNDADAYLANYHSEFTDTKRNLGEWSTYKRRVNQSKTFINVDLSNMSVIEYPGEQNLVAVRFFQDYQSSNYRWKGWKHLLWRRDAIGTWRILYEGNG